MGQQPSKQVRQSQDFAAVENGLRSGLNGLRANPHHFQIAPRGVCVMVSAAQA